MSVGSIRIRGACLTPEGKARGKAWVATTRRLPSARAGKERRRSPPSEARSAQPAGTRLPPQLDAAQPRADAQPDGDHRCEATGEQRGLPEVRRHGALVVPDAVRLEHALAHDDLLKEADSEAHHRRAAVPRLGTLRESSVGLAQIATITS